MFLKSLQMVGFKSFADRTTLEFHPGMTAVVGPNGCGKSNVLDAIRWVLGEQSARALRGSTMQDVIFGGADGRKSLSMAEVSLTFGNCEKWLGTDYHEITVTRRAFRDGQSEYEINQTPCRLRDVQQLFMDTGIGRAAYSMMEQGKIDAILSSKPEDRRAVFEEAAGITRFKAQKKEALRKLELVDGNLLRLGDVMREVERQMNSLQRQASKARRYQETAEKLKSLDLQAAAFEFENLQNSLRQKQERVTTLQLELAELERTLEQKQAALRQRRGNLEEIEAQLHAAQRQHDQLEHEKKQACRDVEHAQEQILQWEAFAERSAAEKASMQRKIEVQQAQAADLDEHMTRLSLECEDKTKKLNDARASFMHQKEEAARLFSRRNELERASVRARQEHLNAQAELARFEEHAKNHALQLENMEAQERRLQAQIAEREASLQATREQLQRVREEQAQAESEADALQSARAEKIQASDQTRAFFLGKQSSLTQIEARMEALACTIDSEKTTATLPPQWIEARRNQGILGSLLEQMRAQPGYEKALEKALGIACDAWIVENADALERLSHEMKDQGTAVWICANGPTPPLTNPAESELLHPKAAERFVQVDDRFRPLCSQLLKDWYFAEDAEEARRLNEEMPQMHVVTRAGEIWHGLGWQLRGTPSAGASAMLLERRNELTRLEEEKTHAQEELRAAHEQAENARQEKEAAEASLSQKRIQIESLHVRLAALQHEANFSSRGLDQTQGALRQTSTQLQTLRDSHSASARSKEELEQKVADARTSMEKARQTVEALLDETNAAASQLEHAAQLLMEAQIAEAASAQQKQALVHQKGLLSSRTQELVEQLDQLEQRIASDQASIEQAQERMRAAQDIVAQSGERILNAKENVKELEEARKRETAQLDGFELSLQDERRQTAAAQSTCSEEQVAMAQERMRLERVVERVRDAYHADLEEYVRAQASEEKGQLLEPERREAIQAEAAELRAKLDQMGSVNLEAITEFEELSERDCFLKQQREDLDRSKRELTEAIGRMDATTQTMFAETFEAISTSFSETFTELFGGGRASLSLADEGNPLESGIEIVAKPPGKQLQNLSLLSGGEKTMTAVALLFSIYKVKPSPFCILDEMDAPLDESNIGRFVQMLQGFLRQSQFVVITHNKKTIAACDILYGVTMQEHGVSKIVSVRLARKEEKKSFPESEAESSENEDVDENENGAADTLLQEAI